MRSNHFTTLLLTATFASAAFAQNIEQEAVRHGYQLLPSAYEGGASSKPSTVKSVYIKVNDPRHRISVLDTNVTQSHPADHQTVINFEIDCTKGALKYLSVQALDSPWNLRTSSLALPKTVWHVPKQGSVPALALGFACKA